MNSLNGSDNGYSNAMFKAMDIVFQRILRPWLLIDWVSNGVRNVHSCLSYAPFFQIWKRSAFSQEFDRNIQKVRNFTMRIVKQRRAGEYDLDDDEEGKRLALLGNE